MAGATGRTREVTLSLFAERQKSSTFPSNPSDATSAQSSVSAWGGAFGLGVNVELDYFISTSGIPPSEDELASPPSVPEALVATLIFLHHRVKVTASITVPGETEPTVIKYGPWGTTSQMIDGTPPTPQLKEIHGEADLSATFILNEWYGDGGSLNIFSEHLAGDLDYTIRVTGGGTILWYDATPLTLPALDDTTSHSTSPTTTVGGYTHTLSYLAYVGRSCRAAFLATGPGFQYTDHVVTGGWSGSSISGTANDATFSALTSAPSSGPRQGTVTGSPDWAYSLKFELLDYETGAQVETGAPVNHYYNGVPGEAGAQYVGSGSVNNASPYQFPSTGYRRICIAELQQDTFPPYYSANQNYPLHDCRTSGGTPLAGINWSYFCLDETWADGYGILLDSSTFSGNNKVYVFRVSPAILPAQLTFAAVHRYRPFESTSYWPASPPVVDDAGALKFVNTGTLPLLFQPQKPGPPVTAYTFRPNFYRYHRIRAKASVAGFDFTLRILYQEDTLPSPPTLNNELIWDFRVTAADTWQTFAFDLAFPDRVSNASSTPFPYVEMRRYAQASEANSFYLQLEEQGTLWIDWFEGYHQPEAGSEERIPILFCGPLSESAAESSRLAYDTPTNSVPTTGKAVLGGSNYARIFANGVVGADWSTGGGGEPGSGLTQHWNFLKKWYDDLTNDNDTGVTIVLSPATGPPAMWAAEALPADAYSLATPTPKGWFDFPLDSTETILARARQGICGYYGMGDPTVTPALGAGYSVAITLSGFKQINGEVCGLLWRGHGSLSGRTVSLHDNDTGALLESDTSNLDGFYRLFHKYGVVRAHNNLPAGSAAASRVQFSGTYPTITYTTLGKTFNAYWLKGDITPTDAEGYLLDGANRYAVVITDRHPWLLDLGALVPGGGGLELAQAQAVALFRAYREGAGIVVERSVDAGVTWAVPAPTGTVLPTSNAADDASPALCLDRWDTLWLWYHDTTGHAVSYRSDDMGHSWTPGPAHGTPPPPLRHPRGLIGFDGRHYLAAHDGSALKAYGSADQWATLVEEGSFTDAADEPFAFFRDRRDLIHLIYANTGGALRERHYDGLAWSSPVTVGGLSGSRPSASPGFPGGALVFFTGSDLALVRLNVEHTDAADTPQVVTGAFDTTVHVGVLQAHAGPFGDDYYLYLQEPDGDRVLRWSRDGQTWAAPT